MILRMTGGSRLIAAVPLLMIAKIVGRSAGTLAKMSARYDHFILEEMPSEAVCRKTETDSAKYPQFSLQLPENGGPSVQ